MDIFDGGLSRIDKLFVDRDQTDQTAAHERRQSQRVVLLCGDDVATSYTLQLAVITAANIASRCFPGAVRVALNPALREAPLLLWPSMNWTVGQALASVLEPDCLSETASPAHADQSVIFGNAPATRNALRATFDGWIAKVGPAQAVARLPEREYCSLAGVLTAALAISELFLSFAEISIEARYRTVALSLWRPDADVADPLALGVPVEFAPSELWVLGLGHLGNAYLWSVATLPYRDPKAVEISLFDFDRIEKENVETGLIFEQADIGSLKTRTCAKWLEVRDFRTKLVERRFDSRFRRQPQEPELALCGFDSNPARRDLATARFTRVVESGLGGTANNFDTVSVHTLPNPRSPKELWPDLTRKEAAKRQKYQEQVARDNPGYGGIGKDACGRLDLAGKAVAVPFVGAAAATLVVAETLRLFHDGPAHTDIKLALGNPAKRMVLGARKYAVEDSVGINYCDVRTL
jgi:hypothetical protein